MLSTETADKIPDDEDVVQVVVDALRQKFGKDALAVARAQAVSADQAMVDFWQDVSERLSG